MFLEMGGKFMLKLCVQRLKNASIFHKNDVCCSGFYAERQVSQVFPFHLVTQNTRHFNEKSMFFSTVESR